MSDRLLDHECYLYTELFEQLDTSDVESLYSIKGQHAYHPRQIISILIYAYSRGVFSSRQIEHRCREDLSFMFIAQMNCPNFHVLSDFRKNHGSFFQDCFKQTVKLAMELELASLGHISLDGSKFKANSSKHKAMSYARLKEKEQALTEKIDALIEQAHRCDQKEDQAYRDKTGYEIPEDLQLKQQRLAKIKAAKQALEVRTDNKESLRQNMNRKMRTPEAREIYRQRKVIVEPVFGQIPKGHKLKTVDFADSACAIKTKSPESFPSSARHTTSKNR